jgi:hypothetical protein
MGEDAPAHMTGARGSDVPEGAVAVSAPFRRAKKVYKGAVALGGSTRGWFGFLGLRALLQGEQ